MTLFCSSIYHDSKCSHWRMGDPEGVLGGLSGGGATVYLPKLDMALVARNTPKGSGNDAGIEVHPVECVQLSLVDQDLRNKKKSRQSALNFFGNTLSSFFGDSSEDAMANGTLSAEETMKIKLSVKCFFKEGQNIVQLIDLASPQRRTHNVTLPPSIDNIHSIQRVQEALQTAPNTVVSWVISGSQGVGGSSKQGLLSFNLQSKEAVFMDLDVDSHAKSFLTEKTGSNSSRWRAESVPLSLVQSSAAPFVSPGKIHHACL